MWGSKKQEEKVYPELKPFGDEEFEYFVSLCESEDPAWQVVTKTDEVVVTKRPDPKGVCSIDLVRVRAVLDCPPLELIEVLNNSKYRKVWDERAIKNGLVATIGDDKDSTVNYYSAKAPTGLSNRDFCTQKGARYNWRGKKEWILFNKSVEHPLMPEQSGFVRAISFGTGNFIRETDDGKSDVTYIGQADLKGWVPGWAVTWATTTTAPSMMKRMEGATQKYSEWKKENQMDDYEIYLFDKK
eukprot:TRINITY_DN15417_c0_g1_i1.p1 TRINITY_DN15417_c0_g1~~TRINITY_DN15417_c0_g1_i1.p1  ORF type:complete len:252 (-),score=64.14 TRINITY_DN15417_c0_g1_i1:40-765(-)